MDNLVVMGDEEYMVINKYRSERYDIDRLELYRASTQRPHFVRGFRVADQDTGVSCAISGEDGDNLAYSLCLLQASGEKNPTTRIDAYLEKAMLEQDFLILRLYPSLVMKPADIH